MHHLRERRSLALDEPVGGPPSSPNPLARFRLEDAGGLLGGAAMGASVQPERQVLIDYTYVEHIGHIAVMASSHRGWKQLASTQTRLPAPMLTLIVAAPGLALGREQILKTRLQPD